MSHDLVRIVNSNYHNIRKLHQYITCNGTIIGEQGPQGETGPQGPQGDPAPYSMRLIDYTRFHASYAGGNYSSKRMTDMSSGKNYVELPPNSSTTTKRYLITADWITNILSTSSDITFTLGRWNTSLSAGPSDPELQNSVNLANSLTFAVKPLPNILNTSPIEDAKSGLAVHNSSLNTGASNNHMQIIDIPPNATNTWRYYIFFTYYSSNTIYFTNVQLFLYEIL